MKSILLLLLLAITLSSCGYKEVNQMILESNERRLQTFADGMKACGTNAACQVGLSMAFAGNMGQQEVIRPESARDYVVAITPLANIFSNWFNQGQTGSGINVKGTNNTVYYMKGNTLSESQNYVLLTPSTTQHWYTQTGVEDAANAGSYTPTTTTTTTTN